MHASELVGLIVKAVLKGIASGPRSVGNLAGDLTRQLRNAGDIKGAVLDLGKVKDAAQTIEKAIESTEEAVEKTLKGLGTPIP